MSNIRAEKLYGSDRASLSPYTSHKIPVHSDKKKFMGFLTYKALIIIGEVLSTIIVGGIVWADGIADIKSIIGILLLIGMFIMRFVEWRLKIADKKLDRKIKEYDFNKKVERDRQNIKP
jgi:hypothetical protein